MHREILHLAILNDLTIREQVCSAGRLRSQRRCTTSEKLSALRAFAASGLTLRAFCALHGLNTKSFCTWRREHAERGKAGLRPKENPRNTGNRGSNSGRVVPADERCFPTLGSAPPLFAFRSARKKRKLHSSGPIFGYTEEPNSYTPFEGGSSGELPASLSCLET